MTNKHTPGPWKVSSDHYHICKGATAVAAVFGTTGHDAARSEANARLIAAAPELLEALEHALTTTQKIARGTGRRHYTLNTLQEMADAIKAAKGNA